MTPKVRYVLWSYFEPFRGWWNRAVFQLEDGQVTGMAPTGVFPEEIAMKTYETALMLSESMPDRNRLVTLDDGPASVAIMETNIDHQKSMHEMGLPAGAYFILWSKERPDPFEGVDEAVYGRVTKVYGDFREFVCLGVHMDCHGPLDSEVSSLVGKPIQWSRELVLGARYRMAAYDVFPCTKNEIRTLRVVEADSWTHHADDDLDLNVDLDPGLNEEVRRGP